MSTRGLFSSGSAAAFSLIASMAASISEASFSAAASLAVSSPIRLMLA